MPQRDIPEIINELTISFIYILKRATHADIVIRPKEIAMIELTVHITLPTACIMQSVEKKAKSCISDLDSRGYHTELTTIEIGTLGHWVLRSRSSL